MHILIFLDCQPKFSYGHIISYLGYTACCFIGISFYDLIIAWDKG